MLLKVVERHVLPRLVLRTPGIVVGDRFGDGLSERIPSLTDSRSPPTTADRGGC
jgi:hypothetical protein